MSNYNSAAAEYASGNSYMSSWTTPESSLNLTDNGSSAWARFVSATSVLTSTVTAASLVITGLGSPPTAETIRVFGDETGADVGLPVDYMDSTLRSLTTANVTSGDLTGLSSVNLDVTSIIQELVASIDGDEILLRFDNPSYSGTGFSGMIATLDVTYSGGGSGPVASVFVAFARRASAMRASNW